MTDRDRDRHEVERNEDAYDHRTCAFCEREVGHALVEINAGFVYHAKCAQDLCHFCGELLSPDDETVDPTREPFGFKDMGHKAHVDCCREAAWESEQTQREQDFDFKQGIRGGLGK